MGDSTMLRNSAFFQKRLEHSSPVLRPKAPTAWLLPSHYYGDGPPHWTYGKKNQPAETAAHAERERKRSVRRLRKYVEQADDAGFAEYCEQLAELIEGCCPVARCNSQACPLCRRALQRWFVATAPNVASTSACFLDQPASSVTEPTSMESIVAQPSLAANSKQALAALSIMPTIRLRGGNDLVHISRQLRQLTKELHDALDQAGIPFAIGGIDVSYNTHPEGVFRPHYQFHLWAFAPYVAAQRGRAKLHELFPPTHKGHRSAWVAREEFNGNSSGFAYALKTDFVKRCTVPTYVNGDSEKIRQNTRDKPLTVEEHVRLLVMLHILGSEGRLFLHGAKVENGKMGETGEPAELRIRLIPPKSKVPTKSNLGTKK